MNKRYYEHTLPIIRGSLSNTYIETSAYQELRKLVSTLAVQMGDFQKKIAPPAPDK